MMDELVHREMPSPNFNERAGPVTMVVLHYTGMESAEAAIERLCDPEAGVSAHYVIDEGGTVTQLVDEDSYLPVTAFGDLDRARRRFAREDRHHTPRSGAPAHRRRSWRPA